MRFSPLMIIPPALFLGLALAFYLGLGSAGDTKFQSTFIGKPAPDMTEAALEGYAGIEGDLAGGQLTLVNFWASWCPPCRAEHPELMRLAGEGLRIVGVNFNDQKADALRYLSREGNPFAAVPFDPNGRTSFDWGVAAPPETFILAPDGTVLFKFVGPLVGSDYRQRFVPELEKALAAHPATGQG